MRTMLLLFLLGAASVAHADQDVVCPVYARCTNGVCKLDGGEYIFDKAYVQYDSNVPKDGPHSLTFAELSDTYLKCIYTTGEHGNTSELEYISHGKYIPEPYRPTKWTYYSSSKSHRAGCSSSDPGDCMATRVSE